MSVDKPLEQAVERIRRVYTPDARQRYTKSLVASLTIDIRDKEHPQPVSPDAISAEYNVDNDDLSRNYIVLKRKQIKSFLNTYYGKHLTSSEITRLFKNDAYELFFGRKISKCAKKTEKSPTIYTYAEVIQLIKYSGKIHIPDSVISLFKAECVSFPSDEELGAYYYL